jgi:hypothetical protein
MIGHFFFCTRYHRLAPQREQKKKSDGNPPSTKRRKHWQTNVEKKK